MGKITGIFVDTKNKTASAITVDDELETYYKLLDCKWIEIAPRKIGNSIVNIICDEEGLLKQDPLMSAVDGIGNGMLAGSLFITGLTDDEGDLTSLAEEDQKQVLGKCMVLPTRQHPEGLMMVTECEYDM